LAAAGTAATVDALLAGPGRLAHVVLLDLDLDLGDGTAVERNVAAVLASGPAVLVLSASDKPASVRSAIRAGARGYVLKSEEPSQVAAAIRTVAEERTGSPPAWPASLPPTTLLAGRISVPRKRVRCGSMPPACR
jgi:DNA-binding NarL/FixJ family response regulator